MMVGDGEMEERECGTVCREMWMRGVDLRERRTVGRSGHGFSLWSLCDR